MAAEIPALTGFFKEQNFLRKFTKGQVICAQGEPFSFVFMVNDGIIKCYDIDETGAERTIAIFAHKSIFPLIWLMEQPPSEHLYYYEAFTDVSCFLATPDELQRAMELQPSLMAGVADGLVKSYVNLAARLRNLERSHVHERLEFVLYVLAVELGSMSGEVASIDTAITQEDISRLAGVTRESISIEMNGNASKQLMWREGHTTFIDMGKLNLEAMPAFFPKEQLGM